MKFIWFLAFGSFVVQGGAGQSRLPVRMPENISIAYDRTGGMSRSYTRIKIENGRIDHEELINGHQPPVKWSAEISEGDLTQLYRIFVTNRFDTIKNDKRQGVVYDAGSESISISIGVGKSFGITYGKNSPLSGQDLERYRAVKEALDDLIGRARNISMLDCRSKPETNDPIQGTWRATGMNGRHSWFLEWSFRDGSFELKGYPPLYQKGKYKITSAEGDRLAVKLYDQSGNFGEKDRSVEITIDAAKGELTILGTSGFSRMLK